MRRRFSVQGRLDCGSIADLQLNVECRDEIVPILSGLQYVFSQSKLRSKLAELIAVDINEDSRSDLGREGFNYWQIVVLAAIRLGCNLDYDKLQDLAENHLALRCLLQVGAWDDTGFSWRRIRDTLCMLKPDTVKNINQVIVSHGQELHGDARSEVRADSFVIETNIHYPTESSLILDGVRKIIPLCVSLAEKLHEPGWRQSEHLKRAIKKCNRVISQISSSKSPKVKAGLPNAYKNLLDRTQALLERAKSLQIQGENGPPSALASAKALQEWIELTEKICDNAHRRVILGESVPNQEKLFSLFETHTQLYRRGKAGTPNQFGRLLLVFEDKIGFISHYHLMGRDDEDKDVIVAQTRQAQKVHKGEIEKASFDRGFHSAENEKELSEIVASPCLPPKHPQQYAKSLEEGTVEFHQSRQRHPGIESAIGALQRGNGLNRCRDRSELGMERYIGLAILGRNLQTLGKLLIAQAAVDSNAAISKRNAA